MNKCRAPKIPPIFEGGAFFLHCKEKAKLFNDYFTKQCKLIVNDTILPEFYYMTDKRISSVSIESEEILTLIRNLNPNKAGGNDGINFKMLNSSEKKYLFSYHMDTYAKISKFLNSNEKKWLLSLI